MLSPGTTTRTAHDTLGRVVRIMLLVMLGLLAVLDVFRIVMMVVTGFFSALVADPEWSNVGLLLLHIPTVTALVYTVIGFVRLQRHTGSDLPAAFNYPLQWQFASLALGFFVSALRAPLPQETMASSPIWLWLLPGSTYLLLCILHFGRRTLHVPPEARRTVSNYARLADWFLDLVHLVLILVPHMDMVMRVGWRWEWLGSLRDFPTVFLLLSLTVYYFSQEVVFLRTIGKLHNRSFVVCERGRIVSVLIRTVARLLPFEAFSFIGNREGWHDRLSSTTVEVRRPLKVQAPAIEAES